MSRLEQTTGIDHAGTKIVAVWAAVGITSWADVAAFLAAIYSMILIGEWCWKKILRPFAERRGWVQRKARRADDRPD